MARRAMRPPLRCTFEQVYEAIQSMPGHRVEGLATTGTGVGFGAEAKVAGDGRRHLSLPHSNRIYQGDWGFGTNSMGGGGQWIGQYARPLDEWCAGQNK